MDAVKGRCTRSPCRYFHPPLHLQAQIKAAQSRAVIAIFTTKIIKQFFLFHFYTLNHILTLFSCHWITSHVNWKVFLTRNLKKVFHFKTIGISQKTFLPRLIQWKLISSSSSSLSISLSPSYPSYVFTYIFIKNFSKSLLFPIKFSFECKFAVLSFTSEFTS